MIITWIYGRTFVVERNRFNKFRLQTWAIPKYQIQYRLEGQKQSINNLIEKAIIEAEKKGVKVLSLGLLNQDEELNEYGGLYIHRHPQLRVKLVDGSSLAAAIVVNSLPEGTSQVLLRGNLTKVAHGISFALCQKGIKVVVAHEDEYEKLTKAIPKYHNNVVLLRSYDSHKVWLVGDGLTKEDQLKAPKGILFMPFSQFPPQKLRKDCFYHTTPAMLSPKTLENVDSCENWLSRRVMSTSRVAWIVHALEGWEEHECGYTMSSVEKVWEASLKHGFQPLKYQTQAKV